MDEQGVTYPTAEAGGLPATEWSTTRPGFGAGWQLNLFGHADTSGSRPLHRRSDAVHPGVDAPGALWSRFPAEAGCLTP